MKFPEPVISVAIEPKSKADEEKMGVALGRLAEEDPTFRVRTDNETNQTIIAGMGELHLDILVDRMRREFNVQANVGATPGGLSAKPSARKWSRKANTSSRPAGAANTATCGSSWNRCRRRPGLSLWTRSRAAACRGNTFPPWKRGCGNPWKSGPLAGYPMVDFRATLFDGSFHEVDSNEMAFKIAASLALKDGVGAPAPC
jgi:elongation factor G